MRTVERTWLAGLFLLAATAAPVAAQQPSAQPQQPATATAGGSTDPQLVFEREIFNYPGRARRDPFIPLTGANAGILFSDLTLKMILYVADNPRESIISVTDISGKQHRLRRGDTIGNATVVDIGETRVVFSVSDFGIRRQQVLQLKPPGEGA